MIRPSRFANTFDLRWPLRVGLAAFAATAGVASPASASSDVIEFSGAPVTWTVPNGICGVELELIGGPGGSVYTNDGESFSSAPQTPGSRVAGVLLVTSGEDLTMIVGGPGESVRTLIRVSDPSPGSTTQRREPERQPAGGYNGGGPGGYPPYGEVWGDRISGSGGGGATEIRRSDGTRLVVAGGGGGHGGDGILSTNTGSTTAIGLGGSGGVTPADGVHGANIDDAAFPRGGTAGSSTPGLGGAASADGSLATMNGADGAEAVGGAGGVTTEPSSGGGGGGGGYFGGGGGGAALFGYGPAAGGGAGSNLVPATMEASATDSLTPAITIGNLLTDCTAFSTTTGRTTEPPRSTAPPTTAPPTTAPPTSAVPAQPTPASPKFTG